MPIDSNLVIFCKIIIGIGMSMEKERKKNRPIVAPLSPWKPDSWPLQQELKWSEPHLIQIATPNSGKEKRKHKK